MGKRIFLFITGLLLAFIGGLFMWLMGNSFLNAQATRAWDEVPATVLQAEVIERQIGPHVPKDYAAQVLFGYEYNGERLTSERLTPRGTKWAKDKEKAEHELKEIQVGTEIPCWVNPKAPDVAILKHDTKAAGYSIWFPTLFFVGGIGVMAGAFKRRNSKLSK